MQEQSGVTVDGAVETVPLEAAAVQMDVHAEEPWGAAVSIATASYVLALVAASKTDALVVEEASGDVSQAGDGQNEERVKDDEDVDSSSDSHWDYTSTGWPCKQNHFEEAGAGVVWHVAEARDSN